MEIKIVETNPAVARGTAGLRCHAGGQGTTVSALSEATGGIGNGRFVETSKG